MDPLVRSQGGDQPRSEPFLGSRILPTVTMSGRALRSCPPEVLKEIARFLDPNARVALASTGKEIRAAVLDVALRSVRPPSSRTAADYFDSVVHEGTEELIHVVTRHLTLDPQVPFGNDPAALHPELQFLKIALPHLHSLAIGLNPSFRARELRLLLTRHDPAEHLRQLTLTNVDLAFLPSLGMLEVVVSRLSYLEIGVTGGAKVLKGVLGCVEKALFHGLGSWGLQTSERELACEMPTEVARRLTTLKAGPRVFKQVCNACGDSGTELRRLALSGISGCRKLLRVQKHVWSLALPTMESDNYARFTLPRNVEYVEIQTIIVSCRSPMHEIPDSHVLPGIMSLRKLKRVEVLGFAVKTLSDRALKQRDLETQWWQVTLPARLRNRTV